MKINFVLLAKGLRLIADAVDPSFELRETIKEAVQHVGEAASELSAGNPEVQKIVTEMLEEETPFDAEVIKDNGEKVQAVTKDPRDPEVEEPKEVTKPKPKKIKLDDIRTLASQLMAEKSSDALKAVFTKLEIAKLSELNEERYPECYELITEALNG